MTDERMMLVIASHWDVREEKQEDRLVRLEPVAQELRELLLDPARGECLPAAADGLLLNPSTVDEVARTVEEAFRAAQSARASLLLVFLGHGHHPDQGDFLFPLRSSPARPGPETAYDLTTEVGGLAARYGGVPELTLMVDGCYSGLALREAMGRWTSSAMLARRGIAWLASSQDDRVSYDLQVSRGVNRMVRRGDVRLAPFLHVSAVRRALSERVSRQVPQGASYDGSGRRSATDIDPWLSRNVAYTPGLSVLAGATPTGVLLEPLRLFQSPRELAHVARLVRLHRLVAVVGAVGTGKTTLATALSRAELLPEEEVETTPEVCAVVRLDAFRWGNGESVLSMARQLGRHLPGFAAARKTYAREVPQGERALLPSTVREVGGPLRLMPAREPVRVIVDGIDQVTDPAQRAKVITELTALGDTAPDWFGVVATVREGIALPDDWHRFTIPVPDERQQAAYLDSVHVKSVHRPAIHGFARGNWQLLTVLSRHGHLAEEMRGEGFTAMYDTVLAPLRNGAPGGDPASVDTVLTVVAASGTGTSLPRPLLVRAAAELHGPDDDERTGLVLDLLAGLVTHGKAPSGTELVGVHHPSLAEYVALSDTHDVATGHAALCRALEMMAPMDQHTPDDPLHRYAEQSEPEHLWQASLATSDPAAAGALRQRLLRSLELRAAPEATTNRGRWEMWAERLGTHLGPESEMTLHARARTAYWTGKAGAYGASLALYQELLSDQGQVLAADDPEVLETRSRIAYATGEAGDFTEALVLHRAVLADQTRVLGADDPRTLKTRHHLAYWAGRAGDRAEALRLHEELLPDLERVLGPTHLDVFEERHYIAYWHGVLGRHDLALELHDELLRDRIAEFGEEHAQVVFSRMNIYKFLGESGRREEALAGYRALLPLAVRVRGALHPNTLLVRLNTARFTWELGDPVEALALHEELVRDQRETLGHTHPAVMITRYNIIMLKLELGDTGTLLSEIDTLLEERVERYRNPHHPEVVTTRFGRALILAALDDVPAAVALLREVVADRARVLGEEHDDTRKARTELDRLLGL
ncbi:tetratricopeptide repeat protein [Streptomyces sp. NPDC058052]|uniref:tetratricopeptide repeat protein n=1 Tax=Streptomyces sp. NPDC058052 TaxID=3346316 RepID=UPI0036E520F4